MQDFDAQIQAFGEQIETELAQGHISFPTALDVSLRIKRLADNPESTLDEIAHVVRAEPVLSAKIVRMANAVALNPYGAPITNVGDAVQRIGLASLRCIAFAVSVEQLAQDHRSPQLRALASGLWMHSADVSAWAYAIARHLRIVNPDTAMFAGMLVDIGQFLLVARAAAYPALGDDLPRFAEFVSTWSEPVGRAVLETFEMPETIVDAFDYENPYGGAWPPRDLADLIFVSTLASEMPNPFDKLVSRRQQPSVQDLAPSGFGQDALHELLDTARDVHGTILAALAN